MPVSTYWVELLIFVTLWSIQPGYLTHAQAKSAERSAELSARNIRRLLARDEEDREATRQLFTIADKSLSSLIEFLHDPDKGIRTRASATLAYTGGKEALNALRSAIASERDAETRSSMCYFLAGGLVRPQSQTDRKFLESLIEAAAPAKNEESAAPSVSAALALAMTGRTDVLPSLKHFGQLDAVNSDEIAKAIRWIEEKNPGSEDRRVGPNVNEDDLVKHIILTRTFFAQKNHDGTTVEEITFNQSRDKVLVFVKVDGLEYSRGYDVVLSKQDGGWHVTGVWFAWISKLQHQTPK